MSMSLDTSRTVADRFLSLLDSETERGRFRTAMEALAEWQELFVGKRVLDFGCSWGTSVIALACLGAAEVRGVEPDADRVTHGKQFLAALGLDQRASLAHLSDTQALPFDIASFDVVLANAVFEHIPQPRGSYIKEVWRVLKPGGALIVNETPNKYFPKEVHTTGLWCNHWLPKRQAFERARRHGRFEGDYEDWQTSGWRGLGYYELAGELDRAELLPERSRGRHRLLSALGLPASLFDPYPVWIFRKRVA
ncbi:MAG: class I SAM-dependent methyltransferase [Bdellovibrionales bacterium]|nr:class I SAM-dependent methyltransferase [Bdellovibrionales bacterium]